MQLTPVPTAERGHQARNSKVDFLSFSVPLYAELFSPLGEMLHCSILQKKISLQKHTFSYWPVSAHSL